MEPQTAALSTQRTIANDLFGSRFDLDHPANVDNPNSGEPMARPTEFTHGGHRVEIVPSDPYQIIGKYWQFRIDGVLQRDLLFSSAGAAALEAENLIDRRK
jgi:hypothetical protein